VDGVYDSDPRKNPNARKFDKLSYMDALSQGLGVMDTTALSLCMDNKLPIVVFDLGNKDNLLEIGRGNDSIGTLVS